MKGCIFRAPRIDDVDGFYECFVSVAGEKKYFRFIDAPSKSLLAKILEKAIKRNSAFVVAEVNGVFAGWAEITFEKSYATDYNGHLVIAIQSEFRRKGIGKALAQMIIAISKKMNLKYLRSDVFSKNTRAIEFFKRFGFQVDGVRPEYTVIDGIPLDVTLLSRKL
jgi:ribosomal protein S18 acetylase RimI-like enzyme